MIVFKAIVIGLLAWQLLQLIRMRRQSQRTEQNTYIVVPPENIIRKNPALLNEQSPPSYYAVSQK